QLVDKEWKMHLNLERPSRADIRTFAQRESLMGVIANLDLLEGNPDEMYWFHAKKSPLTAKTGLAIIKAQYEGESEEFIQKAHAQQEQILELSKDNKDSNLINQTIKSMCLTGAGHLVEPYMLKRHHYESFAYLERRELPKKALATIGITDSDSLQKFIKENTRLAIEESEVEQEDMVEFRGKELIPYSTRLILVAEFYYKKGQPETAKKIITPLLKELQAQESTEWYKVVESIANQRMHALAIELVTDRGNGDNTYQQMVTYLYDDTAETDLIWNTLLKREDITPEKSFRDLAVIMGVYQSEIKTYLQLQDDLVKTAARQGVASLKTMRSALFSVATYRQDTISAKRYAKQLLDTEADKSAIPLRKLEYLRELSNGLDWNGIVILLDEDSSFIRKSAKWHAVYSIAKRKLGDIKAADRLLNHSKLVSIGLNDELRDIALEHYLAGYYDISTQIIERILIIGSVNRESNLYQFALGYLSGSDNAYTNTQQWGKAAAFFMVKSAADLVERSSDSESSNIGYYISDFYNAKFTRGMELYLAGEKPKGLKILTKAHEAIVGDGNLADHFYPAIRTTDLTKQYDLWVEDSHQYLKKSIDEFPECANTHNTLAWVLSRAVRKIDTGIKHSEKALRITPFEASYIDTMGELYHAKGDRKKAIQWGEKAVMASKYGRLDTFGRSSSAKMRTYSLSNQLERFRTQPHPKP
ncbi:MAG: tetratricopeptide (TPR) repeat protein, partial [Cryomorphaceae bacterium]